MYADDPVFLKWRIPADAEKVGRFYRAQKNISNYIAFANTTPIVGVYDDHDTGENDSDHELFDALDNDEVQHHLMDFLDEPLQSPRRAHAKHGVYTSYLFGTAPTRVLLVLLDNRSRRASYDQDIVQDMLGTEQWKWLEETLSDPANDAEITIVGAGLQMLSRGDPTISESFSRHPQSQAKLFALLAQTYVFFFYIGIIL
jgi:alkaline phosphatase D